MEDYLLCGELSPDSVEARESNASRDSSQENSGRIKVYKGRKRCTVDFLGVWRHNKSMKELIANGVRIMHGLEHRNVLKFYEWYETPKHIWVITELASGGTLAGILEQDGLILPNLAGEFITDIISGLNYLHSVRVIYSDLQPKKIVLDTCECLKLSDFTLARLSESTHDPKDNHFQSDARTWFQLKKEGASILRSVDGSKKEHKKLDIFTIDYLPSPFYAAPEIYAGSEFKIATDLWSLGCVMFEVLTGKQPFCGCSLDALENVICNEAISVDQVELGVWSELVHGLLRKSPVQRFSWKDLSFILANVAT